MVYTSCNAHYSKAGIGLSRLYTDPKSPFYDLHTGFLEMLKVAQQGASEAQLAISLMYKNGQGV